MRKITLGTTYYQNPNNVIQFIRQHYLWVDELIIVDDGSIQNPITSIPIKDPDKKIKLFRIKKDYGFNSHGCRNLIMKQSKNDWVVLLDCDRIIVNPQYSFELISSKNLDQRTRYRFIAHSFSYGEGIHKSINDYLIQKDHFFSAGGYDEELIGIRDGDRSFFRQLIAVGGKEKTLQIDMVLTRRPSSIIKQDSVSKFDKSIVVEYSRYKDLLNRREKKPEPNKQILTFEWEEINPKS